MVGRKPIEKRLMNIENGISNVMDKLCEMQLCEAADAEDVPSEEQEE